MTKKKPIKKEKVAPQPTPFSVDERMQLRAEREEAKRELEKLKKEKEIPTIVGGKRFKVHDRYFYVSEIDAAQDRYVVIRMNRDFDYEISLRK
ncbi:MAG: hypothetical protein ACTSPB_02100 [Candidatus Thorarchaeota archaeon]